MRPNGTQASRRAPTGVEGLDAITQGGLPSGRVTLVTGGPGSGKTIFALGTLVNSIRASKDSGVFVAFEETAGHIVADMSEFDWDLPALSSKRLRFVDAKLPDWVLRDGDCDLGGLIALVDASIRQTRATRLVLDGIDVLLSVLGDPLHVRRELFRLRTWLLEHRVTTIITAKTDAQGRLAPEYDFLSFMADSIVHFSHRLAGGTAFRTLRVPKLRGARHSANEFPFAFGHSGIELSPGALPDIDHPVSSERVQTGVARLDQMLHGGYFRGTSVLVSGVPGTAKTTLAGAFAEASCRRGERTLFVSFDEAPQQIVRNLESVQILLGPHVRDGRLRIHGFRSRAADPESHLSRLWSLIREHRPEHLVVDPLSALQQGGERDMAEAAAVQVIDLAKRRGMTVFATALLPEANPLAEASSIGVSTVADTWLHLSYVDQGGERNRALTIIKSRGMSHSNQVRELILRDTGVSLADVYMAGGKVLMGTLRWEKEREQQRGREMTRMELEQRRREAEFELENAARRADALGRERAIVEAQVARVHAQVQAFEEDLQRERQERRALREDHDESHVPQGRTRKKSRKQKRG